MRIKHTSNHASDKRKDTPFTDRQLSRSDVMDIIMELQQAEELINSIKNKLYSLDDNWDIVPNISFLRSDTQ